MIRIVLADDHRIFREGLIGLLERAGLEVVGQCGNGGEVAATVAATRPDVVLLDVTMPGMDGVSVAKELGTQAPQVKVMMLTMHDLPDICRRAFDAGAKGYLLKDDAFNELDTAIRVLLDGKTYVSSTIQNREKHIKQFGNGALTEREQEILRRIAMGQATKVIADDLGISPRTVDVHRGNIMRKLNLHSATELARYAHQTGLV